MKNIRRFFALFLAVVLTFGMICSCTRDTTIEGIRSFSYSYSQNNTMYGYCSYSITKTDDGYEAYVKQMDVPDDESPRFPVDQETVDILVELLNKHKVSGWDGFNKSDKNVLDGNGFELNIHMTEDDDGISAHGYMKYPDGYSGFRDDMDSFFDRIMNEAMADGTVVTGVSED